MNRSAAAAAVVRAPRLPKLGQVTGEWCSFSLLTAIYLLKIERALELGGGMLRTELILLIVLLVGFGTVLTLRSRLHVANARDFFLYGEELRLPFLVPSLLAANLSLGNLVFVCAILGYSYGWSGVFWVITTIIMLFLGLWSFGKRFKPYVETRGNFGTIHDFISINHSRGSERARSLTKLITGLTSCSSLAIAIMIEAHLGTKLIQPLLDFPQTLLMCIFLGVVSFYTVRAGFYSVVFTDVLQCAFLVIATIGGIILLSGLPEGKNFVEAGYAVTPTGVLGDVGVPTAIGLTILGFFWLISTPDTWQRNCATRSLDVSIRGASLACALLVIWVTVFGISGMSVKAIVEPLVASEKSNLLSKGAFPLNDIFLIDFTKLGGLATFLAALTAAGLLMAALSTVDTFLIVIGHVINTDVALARRPFRSFTDLNDQQDKALVARGKLLIMLVAFFILVGWLLFRQAGWLDDPLNIFFITYTLQFCLALPVVSGTYKELQSALATNVIVIVSAAATATVGVIAMINYSSSNTWLLLPAASWLSLLPCIPVGVGVFGYGALWLIRWCQKKPPELTDLSVSGSLHKLHEAE